LSVAFQTFGAAKLLGFGCGLRRPVRPEYTTLVYYSL